MGGVQAKRAPQNPKLPQPPVKQTPPKPHPKPPKPPYCAIHPYRSHGVMILLIVVPENHALCISACALQKELHLILQQQRDPQFLVYDSDFLVKIITNFAS